MKNKFMNNHISCKDLKKLISKLRLIEKDFQEKIPNKEDL